MDNLKAHFIPYPYLLTTLIPMKSACLLILKSSRLLNLYILRGVYYLCATKTR